MTLVTLPLGEKTRASVKFRKIPGSASLKLLPPFNNVLIMNDLEL